MKAIVILASLILAVPANAHNPGESLDEFIGQREPAFETTGLDGIPPLDLVDVAGNKVDLNNLNEQVVVLSFVPEGCGTICDEQQALLSKVGDAVNITPMRDMVTFVVVTDAATRAMESSPNLIVATSEGDVAASAERYATLSSRTAEGPLVHVIDRDGLHAGIFHGSKFVHVNMVLYINGLTNARRH
ncbi:cytochrome-c oxidase [Sedimentitalea sp. XS_ASV28]|uniref:cytochrome-c oxidase n=1 Tax=Sedimentitalea sp. XS_ASV28 TaxID=3241296 RepID=UPI003517C244